MDDTIRRGDVIVRRGPIVDSFGVYQVQGPDEQFSQYNARLVVGEELAIRTAHLLCDQDHTVWLVETKDGEKVYSAVPRPGDS
jgi:hypothetical protein